MNDDLPDEAARGPDEVRYAIGELAEAGGVTRRAVRFYVQRGLIAPPLGGGRGAYYDGSHLAQLLAIKRQQEAGMPLQAIAEAIGSDAPPPPPASVGESWLRHVIAPGVELHLRRDALTAAQAAALIALVQSARGAAGEPSDQTLPTPDTSSTTHGEPE